MYGMSTNFALLHGKRGYRNNNSYLLKYFVREADEHHGNEAKQEPSLASLHDHGPRQVLVAGRKLAGHLAQYSNQGKVEGCSKRVQ